MTSLPTTAEDGAEAFLKLAEQFGAENVYLMIKLLRTKRGRRSGEDVGAKAMHLLARHLVDTEVNTKHLDWRAARVQVGLRLGYSRAGDGATMTNFNKILGDEARVPDPRPSSRYRGGAIGAV